MRTWNMQHGYVLFGIEMDRDTDAIDVAIHLWPITIVIERRRAQDDQ